MTCLLIFYCLGPSSSISLNNLGIYQEVPLAIAPSGRMCLGTTEGDLVILDTKGTLIRKAGGRGQGPGEFDQLTALEWSHSSACFLAYDPNQSKLACFSEQGDHLQDIQVVPLGSPYFATNFLSTKQRLCFSNTDTPALILAEVEREAFAALFPLHGFEKRSSTKIKTPTGPVEIFYRWDPTLLLANNGRMAAVAYSKKGDVFLTPIAKKAKPRTVKVAFKGKLVDQADKDAFMAGFPPAYKKDLVSWESPEFWPMIAKLILDDRDQVWIIGQPGASGHPYTLCNAQGKILHSGLLERLPARIGNNFTYAFDLTSEEVLLRLDPIPHAKP